MKTSNIFVKIVSFFTIVLGRIGFYKYSMGRNLFWKLRARDIDDRWGRLQDDYDVLRRIISSLSANSILDIGCGSGRLFPLYESLGIKEVIGQDVAQRALDLAKARYDYSRIKLINVPIEALDYPEFYFDLVISNHILQHILPNSIESTIKTICKLGRFIYINELSDTDGIPTSPYMFKHDYMRLFGIFGFKAQNKGLLGKQTWLLFTNEKYRYSISQSKKP